MDLVRRVDVRRYSEDYDPWREYVLMAASTSGGILARGWLAAEVGGAAGIAFCAISFLRRRRTERFRLPQLQIAEPNLMGRLGGSSVVPGRFGEIVLGASANSLLSDLWGWPMFMLTGGVRIAIQ